MSVSWRKCLQLALAYPVLEKEVFLLLLHTDLLWWCKELTYLILSHVYKLVCVIYYVQKYLQCPVHVL